ncbi:MAG: hypothetical protein LC643_02495, partial [Bacteroidales bacterium]|nr:hypothetical protein [Bacteroidales bacterium]
LEALEQFFHNVSKNCGLAFVVIQHLDPHREGIMPELLQRTTQLKVVQAGDRMQIQPNHVYVIPPNKDLSVLNGYLHLFKQVEAHGLRLPVDYFFRSLAEDQQANSVGIILSGMGSDGSEGIKAIKEKNGIVMVQDPGTAKFDSMPQNAINAVKADIIAPANELPEKLLALLKFSPPPNQPTIIDNKGKNNLEKIVLLLRTQTGHDFSQYRNNTLFRRIERRMHVHQIGKIASYVQFLQENSGELDILFKELLIGVTSFFRDPMVWEQIKETIFPDLFRQLPDGYNLRAWVTGCSSGEEAYSLAITFKEALEKSKTKKNYTLQIFATDIDKDAIEKARRGFFNANTATNVSPERISRFFTKAENGYLIQTKIREMIVFAPHNVIKDPPFTKLDFIFCRNLLIYMEPVLQKKLMILFHYSLNANGIMVLGSAENENSQSNNFTPIDTKLKFYKRAETSTNSALLEFPGAHPQAMKQTSLEPKPEKVVDNIQTLADQILLQSFAPASVLINEGGDIIYITGKTGKYLEPAAGKANWNVFAMAREGLSHELPGAIRKAKQSFEAVKLHHLNILNNNSTQIVDVTFQQIEKPAAIRGTIMIVFNDVENILPATVKKAKKGSEGTTTREQESLTILKTFCQSLLKKPKKVRQAQPHASRS